MEKLGRIKVHGEVAFVDPCYVHDGEEQELMVRVKGAHGGEADVMVAYSDEGSWGTRVSHLALVFKDERPSYSTFVGEAGVDSGQMMACGVETLARFTGVDDEDYDFGLTGELPLTYSGACSATLGERSAGVLAGEAGVSASGFGDGGYEVTANYDANHGLVSVVCEFIAETEDDEDEDEDEDPTEECADCGGSIFEDEMIGDVCADCHHEREEELENASVV
jgi:hypothetical protein